MTKKEVWEFEKFVKKPSSSFCHSLHVQVIKNLPKNAVLISSDRKKEFNSQNTNVFTAKEMRNNYLVKNTIKR